MVIERYNEPDSGMELDSGKIQFSRIAITSLRGKVHGERPAEKRRTYQLPTECEREARKGAEGRAERAHQALTRKGEAPEGR